MIFLFKDDEDLLLGFGKNKADSKSYLTSTISTDSADAVENMPFNSPVIPDNVNGMVVEIPAPKKYAEARHNVNSGSKTKSYIGKFLKLLKRGRQH